MSSRILPGVILLTVCSAAHAYVLREDSTGTVVHWHQAVVFVLDTSAAHRLGDGAPQALAAAVSEVGQAADVQVSLTQGDTHGVGYDPEHPAENENAIVVLNDWPFSPSAIASTVVTVDSTLHQILDTDIAFNGARHQFAVLSPGQTDDGPSPLDDVQNTATHELGHALGLQHNPDDPSVVMYPSARPYEVSKRTLQADDREGLLALYPPGASQGPGNPIGCAAAPGPVALGLLVLLFGLFGRSRPPRRVPVPVRARCRPRSLWLVPLGLAPLGLAGAARAAPTAPIDRVAEGRVVQVKTTEPKPGDRLLFSVVTIEVARCHSAGPGCQPNLEVRLPGGRWGHLEQSVTDQPLPREGEAIAVALSDRVERVFHLEHDADRAALGRLLQSSRLQPRSPRPDSPSVRTTAERGGAPCPK